MSFLFLSHILNLCFIKLTNQWLNMKGLKPVDAVGVMEGKKEFREKTANRIEVYQKYIASKCQEIEECRNREWTERNEIYIPAEQEIQQVETFSPDLFDRTPQDEDFLCMHIPSIPESPAPPGSF